MAKAVLTISSKNYGAWALRGWLMARLAKRQDAGEMDKIWTDRQVWKRLAA